MIDVCAALLVVATQTPATHSVHGQVRSAGERAPIAEAKIFASARTGPAWTRAATSRADGSFDLTDLPTREFTLTIVAGGHERFEQPTPAKFWTGRRPPVIYVQPSGAGKYRTIVAGSRNEPVVPTRVHLAPEEVATLPGSQGDPLRALQNLPGAARIPGGLGLLVLRGAGPNQSQVFLGEHPVPRAFHFPGLTSVVQGGVLAGVDYVPGNFDSSRGNAVGGVVTMTPRVGRRDGLHGVAKLDITSAGALVEGPVGKGSFLVAGQRGYLDWVLDQIPAGSNTLFGRPTNFDYQVVFDHPAGPGASVTTRVLGARDELRLPLDNGGTTFESAFHRIDLVYRKRVRTWDFLLTPAVRLDRGGFTAGTDLDRRSDTVGLMRTELTARPSQRFRITFGADTQLDAFRSVVTRSPTDATQMRTHTEGRGFTSNSGAYVTADLQIRRLTLAPGVRVSAFTGPASSRAFAVDPRLVARWTPHRRLALTLGAGLYSQPAVSSRGVFATSVAGLSSPPWTQYAHSSVPYWGSEGILILPGIVRDLDLRLGVDPDSPIGLTRAVQLSGGVHLDLPGSLTADATVFFRGVRDGFPQPRADPYVVPDSGSLAYGVELLLRRHLTRRLHGWISYTWLHSDRGVWSGRVLTDRTPSAYDQRHNLALVLQLALPRRWSLGARLRVVTGLPYTPIVGGLMSVDQRGQILSRPIYGAWNGAHMPTFHQLDLRVDKTWVLRRSIVSAYLDVQNVYNRQNPEVLRFVAPYSGHSAVYGLPILPVIGMRVSY